MRLKLHKGRLFPRNVGISPRLPPVRRSSRCSVASAPASRPPPCSKWRLSVGSGLACGSTSSQDIGKAGLSIDAVILPCTAVFVNQRRQYWAFIGHLGICGECTGSAKRLDRGYPVFAGHARVALGAAVTRGVQRQYFVIKIVAANAVVLAAFRDGGGRAALHASAAFAPR